jgi:hypothetical protein
MRILLLWTYYDAYLADVYRRFPTLAGEPYRRQLDTILDDYFGWPPAVARRLAEAGHEVEVVVGNAERLQRAWAAEQGVPFRAPDWRTAVVREQIRRFQPDVLWVGSAPEYLSGFLDEARGSARATFAWIAAPLPSTFRLRGVDCVLTSHEPFRERFRADGLDAEIVLPCFEPRILERLGTVERDVPLSFTGSLSWAHPTRVEFMTQLAARTPLQLWVARPKLASRGWLQGGYFRLWSRGRRLARRSHRPVFGLEMYRVLARSQATCNVHVEVAAGLAGNMRMFEATGCGAVLFTEAMPNLPELFDPESEVVPYTGAADLVERATALLDDPRRLAAIARAGQARTLRCHSTELRARTIADLFAARLAGAAR